MFWKCVFKNDINMDIVPNGFSGLCPRMTRGKISSLYQKEENTPHISFLGWIQGNTSHLSSSDLNRRSIKDESDINNEVDINMVDTRVCALLCPRMTNGRMDTQVKPEYDEWGDGFLGNDTRMTKKDDIFSGNSPRMTNGKMDTRVKTEYDKKKTSSLNTHHLSSSNLIQENTPLLSSNFSPLSSSDLIRRSIKDEVGIPSNNLLQKKKYNSLSSNSSQHKGYNMNLNILPQQNNFNTNPTNLLQQKEYNSNNLPKKKGYNMKQTNLSQSGRSMVEMLGVLAVMGVLSIGAVMGFNYGMNKHRANQVLSDIRLIYQETRIPSVMHNIVNNNSLPENLEIEQQSAYDYSFSFPDLDDFIYEAPKESEPNLLSVNVENVPQSVCDILLQNKPSYVLMLKVNGKSVWSCDANTNEMNYVFEASSDSLEVGTCSICTDSHCFDDDFNCPSGEYCYNDTCSKCKAGYTERTDGNCQSCSFSRTLDFTQENCHRCGDTMYGFDPHWGGNTNCYPCYNVFLEGVSKEYCQKCIDKDENVMFFNKYCVNCKNRMRVLNWVSQADCLACGEINGNGQFAWFSHFYNLCVNCATLGATANDDHTACVCPDNKVWIWNWNYTDCYTCKSPIEKQYTSKTECDKCQNRYYATSNNDKNGKCYLCPDGQVKDTSPEGDGRRCIEATASE